MKDLKGKVAAITGAGSGIGRALARTREAVVRKRRGQDLARATAKAA